MFDKYIERAGLVGGRHPQLPPYRNPPYGALFARRIAIKTANDRSLEDPIFADDFIKKNHKIRISEHIPDLQILGKNNLIGTSYSKNDKICQTLIAVNDIGPQGFYCSVFDGLAFGFGMVRMMAAIDWMRLTPLSWGTVLNDFSDRYSIAPEK